MTLLSIQIDAIVKYIDCLNYCEDNNIPKLKAYGMVVDELRIEQGYELIGGELNPRLRKFMEKHNLKIPDVFKQSLSNKETKLKENSK